MNSQPPTASTRERLLEAAITCIQTRGYGATTVRDICQVSGANLASIGYHFGNKDALLDEALILATERWLDPLSSAGLGDGSVGLANKLTSFVKSLPAHRTTAMAFFEALTRSERSPVVRARLAAAYGRLRSAVLAGMPPPQRTDAALAGAVVALYDGLLVQWLLDPDRRIDAEAIVAGLHAITAPAARRGRARRPPTRR